jgi:hypothetical protein
MADDDKRLYAYVLNPHQGMPLIAAPVDRDWMTRWHERAPYRCLPMVIANQSGWMILNSTSFTAVWDGGDLQENLYLDFGPPPPTQLAAADVFGSNVVDVTQAYRPQPRPAHISSLFGGGVLTFNVPYLFRTPPGVNLWVKGPSNWIKDGAQALEGVVETDWVATSFTMNWKLTRPRHPVRFERGEPICMVAPVPRGLAESLEPVSLPLASNPELQEEYRAWDQMRTEFNKALLQGDPEAKRRGWSREYLKGVTHRGTEAPEHQTRLHLKEFTPLEPPPQP